MKARFAGRFPSVAEALRAFGMSDADARTLADTARANKQKVVRIASAPSLLSGGDRLDRLLAGLLTTPTQGVRVVVRRLHGNQADAWEFPLGSDEDAP